MLLDALGKARSFLLLWFGLALVGLLGACGGANAGAAHQRPAQEPWTTVKHAEVYEQIATTGHFSAGRPRSFKFSPDGKRVLYLKPTDTGQLALFALELETQGETLVADVATLLGTHQVELSAEEQARRERLRQRSTGITQFALSDDGTVLMIPLSGQVFVVRGQDPAKKLPIEGHILDPRLSPDASKLAYVKERDLFVYDLKLRQERRVVRAGKEHVRCGVAEFVAQEEMRRFEGFWWSPDSSKLAYQCSDESPVETLYVQDPAQPSKPASELRYPRAGTSNVSVRLFVHDLKRRRSSEFSLGEDAEYLVDVRWSADARPLPIVQDRAQKHMWMIGCGASKDPLSTCPMEALSHAAWLNIDSVLPLRNGSIWLWSLDAPGGRVVHMRSEGSADVVELLAPSAGYREALGIDAGFFYFRGGPEPTESQIYRVPLEPNGKVEQLSNGVGVHDGTLGKNGHWIDRASLADGSQHLKLYKDTSALASLPYDPPKAPFIPKLEVTKVGQAAYRAAIIRPQDFDPQRRYPVIVSVYGGPLTTVVHNAPRFYFMDQWLADEGFIIVKIDGRGTPHRDDAWEKATYKDVITLPLQDQIAALTALGARYPELDLERVGIQGWSFGGYFSAMAVLLRPDIFKAAVAGAPVTDWHDYDTHYTERYMSMPSENKAGYAQTSALTHAKKLKRPLMLVHGMADDNVLYTHTAKLADALIRENKSFSLVPLVQATHMGGSGDMRRALQFRYLAFFKQHLGAPRIAAAN